MWVEAVGTKDQVAQAFSALYEEAEQRPKAYKVSVAKMDGQCLLNVEGEALEPFYHRTKALGLEADKGE